jgi:hypothetical protein
LRSIALFQTSTQQVKMIIQVEEDESFVVLVRNLQGRVILSREFTAVAGTNEQVLDIPSSQNEILLVNLENDHTSMVRKIALR